MLVKRVQLPILQTNDIPGMPSAVVDVGSTPEQFSICCNHHLSICVLIGPLHLVEHYPFELLMAGIVHLETPSFLAEVEGVEEGSERHGHIDSIEVSPIRAVGGCKGVGSEIVSRPGVHVGVD